MTGQGHYLVAGADWHTCRARALQAATEDGVTGRYREVFLTLGAARMGCEVIMREAVAAGVDLAYHRPDYLPGLVAA